MNSWTWIAHAKCMLAHAAMVWNWHYSSCIYTGIMFGYLLLLWFCCTYQIAVSCCFVLYYFFWMSGIFETAVGTTLKVGTVALMSIHHNHLRECHCGVVAEAPLLARVCHCSPCNRLHCAAAWWMRLVFLLCFQECVWFGLICHVLLLTLQYKIFSQPTHTNE